MGYSRDKSLFFVGTIAVSTFFLLHFTLLPIILIRNTSQIIKSEGVLPDYGLRYPQTIFGGSSAILEINEEEILTGLEIKSFSGLHPRDYDRIAQPFFHTMALSCIGIGLLIDRSISVFRKQGNKSLLALSIGGHAPPMKLKRQFI